MFHNSKTVLVYEMYNLILGGVGMNANFKFMGVKKEKKGTGGKLGFRSFWMVIYDQP